jgi:lipoprotein-anchoring transpeptidase ErfK/SrfK
VSKHRAAHRAPRSRSRVLAGALGTTLVVGSAVIGVLPQLTASPATADQPSARSALASATLPVIPQPVVPVAGGAVTQAARALDPEVPKGTGTGRRIVFDQSEQRVWLVGSDGSAERTYPVSGSRHDNLRPGTYSVLSRTKHATAYDASGTMDYFVHFATGWSEPIGFHTVPRDNTGRLEQTRSQLGTPLSAGCVRQWKPDAIALWDFAPVGTTVVVTP